MHDFVPVFGTGACDGGSIATATAAPTGAAAAAAIAGVGSMVVVVHVVVQRLLVSTLALFVVTGCFGA